MNYGYKRVVTKSFDEVNQKIRNTLQEKGFGVLTEINVKDTLRKKLDVDFKKYIILGACNPPIAHRALSADNGVGLLLPCNVVLWENEDGSTTVAAINAQKMLAITGLDGLDEMAGKVNDLLRQAVDAV
ncbi:MAG: DUF302 domain-containing protein [Fidelibacterota bacterium]